MRIAWDTGERVYTSGISQGVMYPGNSPGVAWNGLVSVTESADNDRATGYTDGRAYHIQGISRGFSGIISAFTYPDELEPFISQVYGKSAAAQHHIFGLSYRTNREVHLVYNVLLSRNTKEYRSPSPEEEPVSLEWDFTTTPVKIPGGKPSSHIVIMVADTQAFADLETLIYGDDENEPLLPLPEDVIAIFESYATLKVTDNGDGTFTVTGPDEAITIIDSTTFRIDWPSVVPVDDTTYRISSL
jgi:hypothetical protein